MRAVARMTIAHQAAPSLATAPLLFQIREARDRSSALVHPVDGIAPDMCLAPLRRGLAPLAPWFF
jgi:hypothetical protein